MAGDLFGGLSGCGQVGPRLGTEAIEAVGGSSPTASAALGGRAFLSTAAEGITLVDSSVVRPVEISDGRRYQERSQRR